MIERLPTRAIFLVVSTVQAAAATAGVDQPWNEPVDGGGSLPGAALWLGLAAAVYFAVSSFKSGASIGESILAGYYGLIFGALVGLPVSCVLK